VLHVAVAVVRRGNGDVLIARRPDHVHQGGLWEFPGGKVEAGETVTVALDRELGEELGIRPLRAEPLIRVPHVYPDREVLLDVWRVNTFSGEPRSLEGQTVRWVRVNDLADYAFPAANLPIVAAASLPERYVITPEAGRAAVLLRELEATLAAGARLLQWRVRRLRDGDPDRVLREAVALCHAHGARLLVNGPPERVGDTGADGVHLTSARLREHQRRPLQAPLLVAASCHDRAELELARRLGADFAVLGPVSRTLSHPGAAPMGWARCAELIRDLPLPVYALGGVGPGDLARARQARAQGVAGIRAFWAASQTE
jgi:8-oxo-dGTP diphosphatase